MKYMGSKRAMLLNGLGDLLDREAKEGQRFVDLFAGSGAVAIHVGKKYDLPVKAYDLQQYSVVLTNAVIKRRSKLRGKIVWKEWEKRARKVVQIKRAPTATVLTRNIVEEIRQWCAKQPSLPITRAYGGHYFSARQSLWIDGLRKTLPSRDPARTVALAALIQAASQCAAAPGHTAQPFQPTKTGKRFLQEAWARDLVSHTRNALLRLSEQYVKHAGEAKVADANEMASKLKKGDVVFVDPPYSGVHYSRFYHVLETIARGNCGEVEGVGRYPVPEKRPRSKYSMQSESQDALDALFREISLCGAKAIVTFPYHKCSNGLSGSIVRKIAEKHFTVKIDKVKSKFSTLGGIGVKRRKIKYRAARHDASEMMLVLVPK